MPQSVKAFITPSVVKWARSKSGYSISDIARKLQTKPEKIELWEEGSGQPTINQIRRFGRILKRPLAFFYLPEPPIDFDAIKDFRRVPGQELEQESPELLYAIRYAHERRSITIELLEQFGEEITTELESININDDPEKIAFQLRLNLGISYENQIRLSSFYEALNLWKDKIESKGVLVFQFGGVNRSEARGFSLMNLPLPVISVNRSEWPQARIFSILHEYIHLMLRQGGLCDFIEHNRAPEEQRVEVFCNRVAGAVLIPKNELLNEPEIRQHIPGEEIDEYDVKRLCRRYFSSREVILRRLLIFGLVTQQFYERKRREYSAEFDRERSNLSGFAPPYRLALSNNGKYYTKIVLRSYYEHQITASTLSEYLGVRLKHIPNIESALGSSVI